MSWRVIEVPTIIMGGEQIANGSKHDDGIGFSFRIANYFHLIAALDRS